MRKSFNILMILCAVAAIVSCSKNKSYTDMLKDERKAIERFIDEQGFEIINKYPADGVFKENQFVKLGNDLYISVVDSGTGVRPAVGAPIFLRASGKVLLGDTFTFNGFDPLDGPSAYFGVTWPIEFNYGAYDYTKASNHPFYSVGLMSGLDYVTDSAIVRLIVPFKLGSVALQQPPNGYPIFYNRVRYVIAK